MYISNTSGQDQTAESFFNEVAKKAERVPYTIRIENQFYSKTVIPEGGIAEIMIPPLR